MKKQLTETFLNLLLPPRCLGCGVHVEHAGAVCTQCFGALNFLTGPQCAACAHPFEYTAPEGTLCAACTAKRPAYNSTCSALYYDDASRSLITRFKYADHTQNADLFARWMLQTGGSILAEADALVPVPLHRWRLLSRLYNQSALIAEKLSRRSNVPVKHLLERVRNNPPQASLSQHARKRNVAGIFRVAPNQLQHIRDKHLILIDDVMTTGSTLHACARILKRSGAKRVDVLVVAKRVKS